MTMADLSKIADFAARVQADEDFRTAKECRETARFYLRTRLPGWRLDHRLELRRAIRFWRHYKAAVRQI
ncbi:MAG: hypothetical protein EOS65_02450 [Mesorhizobium sp.]|uniref:hypothetical protein n=1 Tax=Mesorhizobium sp. TaxID=1871066 RepID=UPI000FEA21E3|nr:hypothetical protein [Mesorhizobium sp.]RWF44256.1 MAG: hypothetical protein EOS65_02450 [Mesorhizobium sp.]